MLETIKMYAYDDLMKAFAQRNKFGNLPYGLRANTWVAPPMASNSPCIFPPLPSEDETWGGNCGGQGRDSKNYLRPWAADFSVLAAMPCKTEEEREIRDRKAFLLHNLFVDVAIFNAVAAVERVVDNNVSVKETGNTDPHKVLHEERIGDLKIIVRRDIPDASRKLDTKIDGSQTAGIPSKELAERNLLKGITADESTTIHDTATLGVVIVRHHGYSALVKAMREIKKGVESLPRDIDIEDQPEGGANALNINSLRTLLHKESTVQTNERMLHSLHTDDKQFHIARALVKKVLEDSLPKLQEELTDQSTFIRWELGACWTQHLQNNSTAEKNEAKANDVKSEPTIKGLGKQFVLPKIIRRKADHKNNTTDPEKANSPDETICTYIENIEKHASESAVVQQVEKVESENELALKKLLSESAFMRLKESGTGLHHKVCNKT
eukprot:Gb_20705 [translate_table: standard]